MDGAAVGAATGAAGADAGEATAGSVVLITERPGIEPEPPMDDREYSGLPLDLEAIETRSGVIESALQTALETRWLE
jgi:hypothetical protein